MCKRPFSYTAFKLSLIHSDQQGNEVEYPKTSEAIPMINKISYEPEYQTAMRLNGDNVLLYFVG